jgi:xanthine dehydrogenase small subunit
MTLLDFIRDNEGLKGTKIGCREGDCGACTVLLGTLDKEGVSYKSVTSCITPLGSAHGKHVLTIEGVNLKKNLNFIQESIAEHHATQCGFCTPGFVISLSGYVFNFHGNSEHNAHDAVSGNICRCTGYKAIEKAIGRIETKLHAANLDDKLLWMIKEGFIPDYFKDIPRKLKDLDIVELDGDGSLVANGTDLYVRFADKLSTENVKLIGDNFLFKGINFGSEHCTIGASTTVSELMESSELNSIFPKLKLFFKLISSQQIRNMGTVAGNIVNASPIADLTLFFLVLDSKLKIRNSNGKEREISLSDFHHGYKKYDLKENEIVVSISFQIPNSDFHFNFEKISKRTHLDIASVNTACAISVKNDVIINANISIGGVAPIPKLLVSTADFLRGREIDATSIIDAEKLLQKEINPIDDIRGSSEYKRLLARQLFFAHFVELFPDIVRFEDLIKNKKGRQMF